MKEELKVIIDKHSKKLESLKENRANWEENKWTDSDLHAAGCMVNVLASILSDLNKLVKK